MGRRRRGNGWSRPKKRTCAEADIARAGEIAPLAPPVDASLYAAIAAGAEPPHGNSENAEPPHGAADEEEPLVFDISRCDDEMWPADTTDAASAPIEAEQAPDDAAALPDAPIAANDAVMAPHDAPAACDAPAALEDAAAGPDDDQVAARMFLWKRGARRRVLFPFRTATEYFRIVDMGHLADEFRQMFARGEDSWCELVLRWLRRQRQRVTITFGELRAAVAAGHRNVLQVVRRYCRVHEDAERLIHSIGTDGPGDDGNESD